MPHIHKEDYERAAKEPRISGELNFAITRLLIEYIKRNGLSYRCLNDCIGACEGAKLEFIRKVVNPYENKKIQENGDAYSDLIPF